MAHGLRPGTTHGPVGRTLAGQQVGLRECLAAAHRTTRVAAIGRVRRLAGQLLSICESLTRFSFGAGCDDLDTALSNPPVRMPEPGKEFVLEADQLTEAEAAELDAYLKRAG